MFTIRQTVDKSKRLPLLRVVFACACALLALAPLAVAQSDPAGSRGLAAPIEGTWILSIHRVNQGITFTALQSFTAGGVTLATGTIDRTPPPPISPLYGSWTRVSDNSYAAAICFFAFDAAGNALVMIKTPETLQLVDDNHLVGTGSGFACDLNGDHCVNINSPITITGKRLLAQASN
jgi:hypothetical protein